MSTPTDTPMARFASAHGITATAEERDSNPNAAGVWDRNASHWLVTLRMGRRSMQVPFSQGAAHTEEPTAADVLECLAMDAAGVAIAPTYEDWCAEYGYDVDSRSAEHTHRVVLRQADRLHRLLGETLYDVLLWDTGEVAL